MNMKNLKIFFFAVLLLLPQVVFAANWQWMAPQRVMSLLKEGSGLWLVDVRSEVAFATGHIEGAVHIPAGLLASKRLPQGKIIVLVDDSLGLRQGREAAETLLKNGHDKVFLLEGGMLAWQGEKYLLAGQPNRHTFRNVMPADIAWAQANRIPVRIFDLRDKSEQAQGPVPQAVAVEGKTLAERLEKAKSLMPAGEKKGLAVKLEKPATIILVFPTASEPQLLLERSFRGVAADVRFLEGGYAAWAAKPDKSIGDVKACPTCPGSVPGGKK